MAYNNCKLTQKFDGGNFPAQSFSKLLNIYPFFLHPFPRLPYPSRTAHPRASYCRTGLEPAAFSKNPHRTRRYWLAPVAAIK